MPTVPTSGARDEMGWDWLQRDPTQPQTQRGRRGVSSVGFETNWLIYAAMLCQFMNKGLLRKARVIALNEAASGSDVRVLNTYCEAVGDK